MNNRLFNFSKGILIAGAGLYALVLTIAGGYCLFNNIDFLAFCQESLILKTTVICTVVYFISLVIIYYTNKLERIFKH